MSDREEELQSEIDRLRRNVTEGEIDRALEQVKHEPTPGAPWVEDRLYVAKLVRHILDARVSA